ncbi:MAG: hypothetical protein ACYSSM_04840 [Planctomycetota bacterium]|jgi:hypothetical protein
MFKIIRFEINDEAFIAAYKTNKGTVERLQDLLDLQSSNGVYYSETIATTSAKYFEAEGYLRALFGDTNPTRWEAIDYSEQYALLRTRAPKDYDYAYCVDCGQVEGINGPERLVAMPKDRVEYQSGRYSSGMFFPTVCS